jgi:hypothetical protein
VVNTSIAIEGDKWFYYTHSFLQHPEDVKEGKEGKKEPIVYCVIECKAVLKERSGKTVPIKGFLEASAYYRALAVDITEPAAVEWDL